MRMAIAQELDAVFDVVHAPAGIQLTRRNRLSGVQSALIDPVLQAVDVQGRIVLLVRVRKAALRNQARQGRLSSFKTWLGLAVARARLLALVTARRRTTTA